MVWVDGGDDWTTGIQGPVLNLGLCGTLGIKFPFPVKDEAEPAEQFLTPSESVAPLKSGDLLSRKKPKHVHRASGNSPGGSGFSRGPRTRLEHWLVCTSSTAALSPLPWGGRIWSYFRFQYLC